MNLFSKYLNSFGVEPGAVLLYDQADDLLSLHDPFLARQQVEVLGKWFQNNQVTTVLSFSRPSDRQSDTFNTLMDYFTGIVRLGGDRDGLELTFLYWQGSSGATVARNFRLSSGERGLYQAVEAERRSAPPVTSMSFLSAAPEVAVADRRQISSVPMPSDPALLDCCYLYNDAALDGPLMNLPGTPLRVTTAQEMVENASLHETVMILLNTASVVQLQQKAKLVHHLRKSLGSKLQIVIYEKLNRFHAGQPLSSEESQLILRSGANAVLSHEQVIESLPMVVRNLHRQIYIRPIPDLFDELWQLYESELTARAEQQLQTQVALDETERTVTLDNLVVEGTSQSSHAYAYHNHQSMIEGANMGEPKVRTNAKAKRSSFAS